MPIIFHLDSMLRQKKLCLSDVSNATNISMGRLRRMEAGEIKEINLVALSKLCELLGCQPFDLLEHVGDENNEDSI